MTTLTEQRKEITFKDGEKKKAVIEINITLRNGYPEFTMCGEYCGSGGQCLDHIKPDNDQQQALIDLWNKWHLNGKDNPLPENLWDDVVDLCNEIEELEQGKKDSMLLSEALEDDADSETINKITEIFSDNYKKAIALGLNQGLTIIETLEEIEVSSHDNCLLEYAGNYYLVGGDEAMDEAWDESLENYIDECILPELPEIYQKYFDNEAFKKDCWSDGRAHSLNRYDGGEAEEEVEGITIYIYRQ